MACSSLALVACADPTSDAGEPASDPGDAPSAVEVPLQVVERDINADGRADTVMIYGARDGESGARAEADTNGDGAIDFWARVGSDEEVEEIAYDRDGDGRPEEWERYEGLHVGERARDTTGDGKPDSWTLYSESGVVTETRSDTDGDGRPDVWSELTPEGRLVVAAYDTDASGDPDRWVEYDSDGGVRAIRVDTDGDGAPDTTISGGGR